MSRLRFLRRKVSGPSARAALLEQANRPARGARRDKPAGPVRRAWRRARERARPVTRPLGRLVLACLVVAALTSVVGLARSRAVVVRTMPERPTVADVTQLNPIAVRAILTPRTTDEVAAAIR